MSVVVDIHGVRYAHPGGFELAAERLTVEPGERAALVGPSGSGKSTLIDLVAGIRLPSRGRVEVLGRSWPDLSEGARREVRRTRIGMAFQEFELLGYLSARDNIELGRFIAGVPRAVARERSGRLAARAGIAHALRRTPDRLSQGERQRVALCRALLAKPPLILCDEPTGNLDPASASAVMELLLEQAREDGASVILATHDHSLLPLFDRVIRLPLEAPR